MTQTMITRAVRRIVTAQEASEGAGVRIRRSIGTPELDHLDPFLLLDEFKSDQAADYAAGFPDHPHRGFETVTYMLAGSMEHKDHKGNHGNLVAGSVQWMTAGRGIIHSEMPRQDRGLMWGFQLWVNLPARDKMTAPRYQDIPPERIPEVDAGGGVRVRVIAGERGGARGPVAGVATRPLYLDVRLPAGSSFDHALPPGHSAFAYVFDGEAEVGGGPGAPGRRVAAGRLAVLGDGGRFSAAALAAGARLLLVAAAPLGEPIARYGPFVMNTREEIAQAVRDFQAGRLLD
ncbi:MAG TPA: pirin family protein [Vicinamibacteria bacterium]|nr:pirin family protein [Vicinamibacteria bacterium]